MASDDFTTHVGTLIHTHAHTHYISAAHWYGLSLTVTAGMLMLMENTAFTRPKVWLSAFGSLFSYVTTHTAE